MKNLLRMTAIGALLTLAAAASALPTPIQHDDQHDRDQSNAIQNDHGYVMHDRGNKEGWYKKGGRVPEDYRRPNYVVNDWHDRHLRQPPRGYHWVHSDNGEFLLIADTTGLIDEIFGTH